MAFETPDLRTLITRAEADIEGELPGATARLRRSNLNVLARVQAGIAHGMYGFIREFLSQCLPWSRGFLLRMWAEVWGVYQQAAVSATGSITFTGTAGSLIPAETVVQTADSIEYATTDDVTIAAAGTATVACAAVVTGAAGNQLPGTAVSLVSPVVGVSTNAVLVTMSGGTDDETLDALYNRYLQRVQNPGHGGNAADYIGWALEVPGVTRAWIYGGLDGVDTIQVYFVRDGDASIIPDANEVATVSTHINAPDRKPVSASVGVYAPIPKPIHFQLSATPDTPAVRAAIEAELRDLVQREASLGATLLLTHMHEAISLADGETDHVMTAPTANVTTAFNEIAVFGGIVWI